MGVVNRSARRVPSHPHPPKLKEVPDRVLRVDNKSGEVQTQTYSHVSVCGLRIPPGFSSEKSHSERWLNLQDFILRLKSKHVFDYKMFDVANWVAHLNGENGPGGTPSHETLSVSPKGALEISLFNLLPWSETISARLEWWQNPANVRKDTDLHPKTTVSKSF